MDVLEVWNAELEAEFRAAAEVMVENGAKREKWERERWKGAGGGGAEEVDGDTDAGGGEVVGVSTEELEAKLRDVDLSAEERK